jgi:hypothetical protein
MSTTVKALEYPRPRWRPQKRNKARSMSPDINMRYEELTMNIACTAYTRFVLDIGQSQDWMALQVAMAPCLLGYGIIAKQLHNDSRSKRDDTNPYWTWIKSYVGDDYVEAVRTGSGKCLPWGITHKTALMLSPQNSSNATPYSRHRAGLRSLSTSSSMQPRWR